jgi:hypothetical protein
MGSGESGPQMDPRVAVLSLDGGGRSESTSSKTRQTYLRSLIGRGVSAGRAPARLRSAATDRLSTHRHSGSRGFHMPAEHQIRAVPGGLPPRLLDEVRASDAPGTTSTGNVDPTPRDNAT